jgi:hypothetical protein
MKSIRLAAIQLAPIHLVLLASTLPLSAAPRPETLAEWKEYVHAIDTRADKNCPYDCTFLRLDEDADQAGRLRRGEVIVSQIKPDRAHQVPHALVHDWIGAIFIPNATVSEVVAASREYERYAGWYGPTIAEAALIDRDGGHDRFRTRYVRTVLFVTAVLEAEYDANYVQVDPTRWYSTARTIQIQEIHQPGTSEEKKMPPNDPGSYLWRIYSVSRYEQRDNGVYVEQENVGLSRQIPASLRWLAEPVVRRLSKDLLAHSLEQTRDAMLSKSTK